MFFRCVLCSKLGVKISRSRAVSSVHRYKVPPAPALLFILSRLLKRPLRAARLRLFCVIKAQRKHQCVLCPRAKWCLPAPLARHPFASHGPNLGRASRLTHSAPSSSQVSVDHRAPGGRSSYPKALEGASGWKKGARHPPTSLRSNSSVVKLRHLSRAQEQQPVRVAVSVSALTACARDLAGALPSGM